ncbi:MAG TPA: tryptophan 7-halogenase [Verrucomicrobiae bacterium]|nr:tryptophan 7-halogenase [Verrucomicrobiae bacterium]
MSRQRFQIAVVGSGFGGSLIAMMAQRLGYSTVLLERGRHPRFAIGESSTPLANLLLEEISVEYDLPFVRPLSKWGTWQKQLSQLACGLKRGFTFFHHEFGKTFATDASRRNQLLVGASPNEEIADTHWYRPDFDHYLMTQAQTLGVSYLDELTLNSAEVKSDGMLLAGTRHGEGVEIAAEFVIDATGPRGFLHRALGLSEKTPANFPPTQGLFSHFENVGPLPESFSSPGQPPPYPPEHAAVHHVFPGGWIWVLKFNHGITSAGVAATDALPNELNFKQGEPAWQRLLERLPSVAEIFRDARATVPFVHSLRLSFQSETVTGARWAMLPSAAGFIDPLLSTGFPLTLLGVQRLGRMLKSGLSHSTLARRLDDYAAVTSLELETAARLVGALYANMHRFEIFKDLSLLYFVAAIFSETVRRLGKPELANGFLLCRHPSFSKSFAGICDVASGNHSVPDAKRLSENIHEAIEPLDLAGLTDHARHPWYPAQAADLLRHAAKVGASETQMRAMLTRCGLS